MSTRITYFTYDKRGNRTAITNPLGKTTYFSYDGLDRLTGVKDPLAKTVSFSYDAVGNLLSRTNARAETTYYVYDQTSALTQVRSPGGATAYYSYDAAGNRLHLQDAHTLTYFTYDSLNRQTAVDDKVLGKVTYYNYDAVGRRTYLKDPEGSHLYYRYDGADRLFELRRGGNLLAYYVYDVAGRRTKVEHGNSSLTYYEYDKAGRVTKLHNKKSAGTVVAGFDYVYDKASRRTAKLEDVLKADASRAQHTIYYDYDKASQLRAENRRLTSDLSLVYSNYFTYDSAGNRTVSQRVETGKDEATYYTYDDADELTQHMKADVYTYFTYDNDGNQTSKKVGDSLCYYNYSPDNMLTTFTEGETEAEYVYDASPRIRRRVKAVVDGAVTYYAFDGLDVLADYDGDVSAQRTFVVPFLDDSLVLRTGGNDYHYTLDALGSVANLLDGNEAVQNDYLYEAFGSAHGTPTQNVTNRLRFTGLAYDTVSGTHNARSRTYVASLGRFQVRDLPGRTAPSLNLYTWPMNQPTALTDPLGRGGVTEIGGKKYDADCVNEALRKYARACRQAGQRLDSNLSDIQQDLRDYQAHHGAHVAIRTTIWGLIGIPAGMVAAAMIHGLLGTAAIQSATMAGVFQTQASLAAVGLSLTTEEILSAALLSGVAEAGVRTAVFTAQRVLSARHVAHAVLEGRRIPKHIVDAIDMALKLYGSDLDRAARGLTEDLERCRCPED